MSRHVLSALLLSTVAVLAQAPPPATSRAPAPAPAPAPTQVPLASKDIPYNAIPERVDTDDGPRGIQVGYNRCNATTEGPGSLCQTSYVNDIDDFCLWAPQMRATIGETEAGEVAWCTKSGRGTRIIPGGALTGVEFRETPDYIQIAGFINQELINIPDDDFGGELDPHGADGRGNPLGGLMYSNAYPKGNTNNNTFTQIKEWTNFMGGKSFCIKVCNPQGRNPAKDCEHVYDRIGCSYNAPNNAQPGQFVKCDAASADFVGVFVVNGVTSTYKQPAESLGPISTVPYQPTPGATSNCITYQSSQLYTAAAPSTTAAVSSSAPASSATGAPSSAAGGGAGAAPTGAAASRSGTAGGAAQTGAAVGMAGSVFKALFAVAAVMALLA